MRKGETSDELMTLEEYWTLGTPRRPWMVQSIEQRAEGDHQLDEPIVASPWSRRPAARGRGASPSWRWPTRLPDGFTTADLAEVDFAGDARARALDLSRRRRPLRAGRARGRRAPRGDGWAEAVDGDDAALEAVASPDAVGELLYGGDATRQDPAGRPRPARQADPHRRRSQVEARCPRR